MAHKYPNVLIHCVFSTKERRNTIPVPLLHTLFKYLNGIGKNIRVPVLAAGGTANHLHMLIALPSDVTLAKAIQPSRPIPLDGWASKAATSHGRRVMALSA